MKQIEFRAKLISDGKWVYGDYFYNNASCSHIITEPISNPSSYSEPGGENYNKYHDVDFKSLGQLIHVSKDGRKWFEGDVGKINISKASYYDGEEGDESFEGHAIGVIGFNIRTGMSLMNYKLYNDYDGELVPTNMKYKTITMERTQILGNIHDNPELLNPRLQG